VINSELARSTTPRRSLAMAGEMLSSGKIKEVIHKI
jgi:hypothetical protein